VARKMWNVHALRAIEQFRKRSALIIAVKGGGGHVEQLNIVCFNMRI